MYLVQLVLKEPGEIQVNKELKEHGDHQGNRLGVQVDNRGPRVMEQLVLKELVQVASIHNRVDPGVHHHNKVAKVFKEVGDLRELLELREQTVEQLVLVDSKVFHGVVVNKVHGINNQGNKLNKVVVSKVLGELDNKLNKVVVSKVLGELDNKLNKVVVSKVLGELDNKASRVLGEQVAS
jgi:hypothetical protein